MKLSKDSTANFPYLLNLVARKRSKQIGEYYDRTGGIIDPTWIQMALITNATPVSYHDTPNVPATCEKVAMFDIPSVIRLPEDRGLYRVAKPNMVSEYYPVTLDMFFGYDKSVQQFKENLRYRVGQKVYAHPYFDQFVVHLILSDPMDGYVYDTGYKFSGMLITGDDYTPAGQYVVVEGSIEHNGVTYNNGDEFTAVSSTFTGYGKVKAKDQVRKITLDDEYPMSLDMANTVILRILSEDFNVSSKQVSDIVNDSQDQLNVLSSDRIQN